MFGDLFDRAFAFDGSGKNRSHHRQYVAHAVLQFADQSLQPRLAFAQDVLGLLAGLDVHAHAGPVADASILGAERHDVQAAPSIPAPLDLEPRLRSEEPTSELQSLMRHSYAVLS